MSNPETTPDRIFAAASEVTDPAARAAYLARACGDNESLRREVESLLAAHAQAGAFLDGPPTLPLDTHQPGAISAGGLPAEKPGDHIGHYKLLEQIGEGGMGSVWMAEQHEPVRRRVALKIIKLGMDSKEVVARFEAERQALAVMDHANIAKVLDGGATSTGRPYFVMELVRGPPMTAFCESHRLTVPERLQLFTQVCQAVQHAHQKGIIHRDLKPSNVLVSLQDDRPVPRVIDFGIAKATQGRLTDKTLFTRFHELIGTPAYMSPEQVGTNREDIDTRSDIYSLGVLLYELLSGKTPFDSEQLLRSGFEEMCRILREVEPVRPSTRLGTMALHDATAIAKARQEPMPSLLKIVRGELDWIVMKCLDKDRTRRYETANSLVADVQRYLNNEPVTAAAPSRLYRAQKFVRRHQASLAALSAIATLLVVGAAVSTWEALRAITAEKHAVAERDHARDAETLAREQKRKAENAETAARADRDQAVAQEIRASAAVEIAQTVNEFLGKDLLMQGSPEGQVQPDFKMLQLLDRASEKIQYRFTNQPQVEASIRATLAGTYHALGEFATMKRHGRRAWELYREELGETNEATFAAMFAVVDACCHLSNYVEAVELLTNAVEWERRIYLPDHINLVATKHALAKAYLALGNLQAALPLFDENLKLEAVKLGPDHPDTLATLSGLLEVLSKQGKTAEAESRWREGARAGHLVAMVNGVPIAERKVRWELGAAEDLFKRTFLPANPSEFQRRLEESRKETVQTLIDQELIAMDPATEEFLESRRMLIIPESVEMVLEDIIRVRFQDDTNLFQRYLTSAGTTLEDVRAWERKKILSRAAEARLTDDISAPISAEIELYYETNRSRFKVDEQLELSIILLKVPSGSSDEKTRSLAQTILTKLEQGASFAEMASAYSVDAQVHRGGYWGWMKAPLLKADLRAIARGLRSNQVSGLIGFAHGADDTYWSYQYDPAGKIAVARHFTEREVFLEEKKAEGDIRQLDPPIPPQEFYLLKVEGKHPAYDRPLLEVRDEIRKELRKVKLQAARDHWLQSLRSRAVIWQLPPESR